MPSPRSARADRVLAAVQHFADTDLARLLDERSERAAGDAMSAMRALAHRTAATVPAYAAFLRVHGFEPEAIDAADWTRLPLMTKRDYFHRHPLADRCRGG